MNDTTQSSDDVTVLKAIQRLRVIEFRSEGYLPDVDARELTASIDALVVALRQQGVLQ